MQILIVFNYMYTYENIAYTMILLIFVLNDILEFRLKCFPMLELKIRGLKQASGCLHIEYLLTDY